PPCVEEGEYRTQVTFEVTSAVGAEERKAFVTVPVYAEVRHRGVRFPKEINDKGGLWLQFPTDGPAPDFVTYDFDLLSDAGKDDPKDDGKDNAGQVVVRWSVQRVAAKNGPGSALAPDDGRVDVLFKDRSVLPVGPVEGKDPLAAGGPRNPIGRGKPCKLTVR